MYCSKNLQGVQQMYETNNMTRGFKPASQQEQVDKKPQIRVHVVP